MKSVSKTVFVGRFTNEQVKCGEYLKAIHEKRKETGLQFLNVKEIREGRKKVATEYWLCDFQNWNGCKK